jgi:hypothetical protein
LSHGVLTDAKDNRRLSQARRRAPNRANNGAPRSRFERDATGSLRDAGIA